MTNNIGNVIKYNRLKSRMTQAELSEGIISVSYLSKIENGSAEPPKEILNLLTQRLQMEPAPSNNRSNIKQWFRHILYRDVEKAGEMYVDTIDRIVTDPDKEPLGNLIEIHKLRYFLLKKQREEASEQFLFLQKRLRDFTEVEKYYWMKFSANYHYTQLNYALSLELYLTAEKLISNDLYFLPEEETDLTYRIALAASKVRNTHLSLSYASKALDYYRNNYNLRNCAECHILIGITYRRANEYEKSLESYRLAMKIARSLNDDMLLAVCNQNLGKYYSTINHNQKAIFHYEESYRLREGHPAEKMIVPISSLMKEYYKKGDLKNSDAWLEKGLAIIDMLTPNETIFTMQLEVYTHLIRGIGESFEELMTKTVLPYLDERKLYFEKYIYLKILADYYFNDRKYKLAASYYNNACNTLSAINKE